MLPSRLGRIAMLVALTAFVVAFPACSGDEPSGPGGGGGGGTPDAYVGSWTAQSFTIGGADLINLGMGLEATFTTTTYSLTITDDIVGICELSGSTECTETGNLSATSSQITFDPGTQDEVVFDYSLSVSTLTLMGTIDGEAVSIVLTKTS